MNKHLARLANIYKAWSTLVLMLVDCLAISAALLLAFCLRFDHQPINEFTREITEHQASLSIGFGFYLVFFAIFRLYRHAWRFASIEMVWGVFAANTLGLAILLLLQLFIDHQFFPRSIIILFWVLGIMLVGGARILLRIANLGHAQGWTIFHLLRHKRHMTRVIILGGGWDGARLLSALHEEIGGDHHVIGFLDDRPQKQGMYIRGVRVLGPLQHLYTLLEQAAVDEVLIAIPEASGADIREYVLACRNRRIPVKVIPGLTDVLLGAARPRLEDISVEDLLRRPPVCTDLTEIGNYLTGKRVLVTGAGGSIGSELCRQILALNPASLILLGHGENSIHNIFQELTNRFPNLKDRLHIAICSVTNQHRVASIFTTYQPQVVFHAAAHKHVPIMEDNVAEAIQNNVFGTHCIAEACGKYRVERMVLISTDKAVFPSSVMGATKWLCEEVVSALTHQYSASTYVTVRFGNVLGSRGSVVPIFKEQIRRGGPVTVTHPEMTRYFMTIPEAVQLVLQAGAIGHSNELFLLDMGKPVKVLDLARDMIRLSGLIPEQDIAITFTGLRPGEKLHEQLAMDETRLQPAKCERMSVVCRTPAIGSHDLPFVLDRLSQLSQYDDPDALLNYLGQIVPGFATRKRFSAVAPITSSSSENLVTV